MISCARVMADVYHINYVIKTYKGYKHVIIVIIAFSLFIFRCSWRLLTNHTNVYCMFMSSKLIFLTVYLSVCLSVGLSVSHQRACYNQCIALPGSESVLIQPL